MKMDNYLQKILNGTQGKLICACCARPWSVLTEVNGAYICDLCKELKRKEDE